MAEILAQSRGGAGPNRHWITVACVPLVQRTERQSGSRACAFGAGRPSSGRYPPCVMASECPTTADFDSIFDNFLRLVRERLRGSDTPGNVRSAGLAARSVALSWCCAIISGTTPPGFPTTLLELLIVAHALGRPAATHWSPSEHPKTILKKGQKHPQNPRKNPQKTLPL